VPEPILSQKLPEGICSVTERKALGEEKGPSGGVFRDYEVKFEVKENIAEGQFRLAPFKGETKVSVKTEDA
jgi:hypothetical protein